MRIAIADCDHDSIDIEEKVVRAAGGELVLRQAHTEDDVIAMCAGADGLIVQYAPVTSRVLDALPTVKGVVRYGVGVDTVDLDAATSHGVVVMNVPDYGTEEVADQAIALAMSVLRGVTQLDRRLRVGLTDLETIKPVPRISRSTFGIIGLGAIGRTTARKAAGVGFHVIGCDPFIPAGTDLGDGVEVTDQDDVVARSDVISLHVPLTRETRHMVDWGFLRSMKDTAIIVNTCRGAVVDTDALVGALSGGLIHGAGLDVFESEPLPADHPLTALDNVVLTPHASWYSDAAYVDLKRKAAEHIVDYLSGGEPRNVVNRGVLAHRGDAR
jgi:D-3-phosphoglycerate dehydrogenase